MIAIIFKLTLILVFEVFILRSFYIHVRKNEPDRYFALAELRRYKSPTVFYIRYFIFRVFPVLAVCLLNYAFIKYYFDLNSNAIFNFNIALVLSELLLTNIRGYSKYKGLGISHLHLLFAGLMSLVPYTAVKIYEYFPEFIPQQQDIIGSIWTAIILYGAVSLPGLMSNDRGQTYDGDFELFTSDILEKKIDKFNSFIELESNKYNADTILVKSIAIYEIIQRPPLFRFCERVYTFLTKIPTTQGVMQYKSNYIISDEESISFATKDYLIDTKFRDLQDYFTFNEIVSKYNFSDRYINDVYSIYSKLLSRPDDAPFDEIVVSEPRSLQEVGLKIVLSGWVPKSWVESKTDNSIFFDLIDINGFVFMASTISINKWLCKDEYFRFWHLLDLSTICIDSVKDSNGRINILIKGQEKKHSIYLPIIVKDFNVQDDDEDKIYKHKNIALKVAKLEEDLSKYQEESDEITARFPHNQEDDYVEKNDVQLESSGIAYDIFCLLENSDVVRAESPYQEEARLKKELDEKYKEVLNWRGMIGGAKVGEINGFSFVVYSDDHDTHFHVIHRGKGVDARFSFPEINIISYKNKRNTIDKKEIKMIKEYFENPENFSKLENEFIRRDFLINGGTTNSNLGVDWNKEPGNDLQNLTIFNQRDIPACAAHAVVTMMQMQWYKKTGKMINFSPRFLDIMSWTSNLGLNDGRDGALVMNLATTIGCCTEDLLPNDTTLPIEQYRDRSIITQEMIDEASKYKLSNLGLVPHAIKGGNNS